MKPKLLLLACAILVPVAMAFWIGSDTIFDEEKACEAKGGVLVRTYADLKCIKVEKL